MKETVYDLLRSLKIPVSKLYLERIIMQHSDYPSLLSIADALERIGINYNVWRTKGGQLKEIKFPNLLMISSHRGDVFHIKNQNDLNQNEDKLDFWDVVIIQIDGTKVVLDKENKLVFTQKKTSRFLITKLLCISFFLSLLPFLVSFNLTNFIFFLTTLMGVFIGYLVVAKDSGIQFKGIESFCNSGKNTDCDEILTSEGPKLLGIIKFSNLVLAYFTLQLIILFLSTSFYTIAPTIEPILVILSLLTIPIILFSIYYQYLKTKAWCKLCLVVNGVFVLQLVLFLCLKPIFTLT